ADIRISEELIFGSQNDGKSVLAEATPIIFQYISFKQHTPGILEYEVIFYDKRIARCSADVSGLAYFLDHCLEHVIAPYFDVCWRGFCCPGDLQTDKAVMICARSQADRSRGGEIGVGINNLRQNPLRA